MSIILITIHLMVVIALVVVVLLQRSEGGALGIGGGGGGVMSARGAANTMTRTTGILAAIFFATSITLGILAQGDTRADSVLENIQTQPVAPGAAPAVPLGDGQGGILDELNERAVPAPVAPVTPVPVAPAGE